MPGNPQVNLEAAVVGKKLRALREELGFKPWQIAQALGMSTENYRHYEAGRNRLQALDLPKIARTFGLSSAAFLERLGLIEESGQPQTIQRIGNYRLIPLADVRVAAGGHSWTLTGDAVTVDDDWARGRDLVAFMITGDCLEPEVMAGSVALVDRADIRPKSGDLVVVIGDDGPMLKRFVNNHGDVALVDNQGGHFTPEGATIVGVVREVRRRY